MKLFDNDWRLFAAGLFVLLGCWAVTEATAQTPSERSDLPARVTKFTHVKSGESCLDVFSRLGEKVSVSDCIKAAERTGTGVEVLWYRPDITRPPTYIVNLHPGDRVGVYEEGAKKTLIIFPRDPVLHLSHPIAH